MWTEISGAIAIALVFVAFWSLLPEPMRQKFNAVFVAGAGGAYVDSALGPADLVFAFAVSVAAYKGLSSYRWIAVAWAMHVVWDVVHHAVGDPILAFDPLSSFGCAFCDSVWVVWFWMGAPSIFAVRKHRTPRSERTNR